MRRALLAVLAALATALSLTALGVVPASAAAAPTLAALPASSQAGKVLTLRGTAPAGSVVTVQRRYGNGRFARIGSARATRSGAWRLRSRLARGGTTSFRAVAGGRTSAVRTLKVYQWLNLVDQPFGIATSFGRYDVTSRVGGTPLPKSIEVNSIGYLAVKTAGLCTQFQYTSGIADLDRSGRDGDEEATGDVERFDADGALSSPTPYQVLSGDGALRFTLSLTAGSRTTNIFAVRFGASDPDGGSVLRAVLGSPRVLCNTNRLPDLPREEFPD